MNRQLVAGGFEVLAEHNNDGAKYTISGDDSQLLQVTVAGGGMVTSEMKSMVMMSDGMRADLECGGCGACCKRCCSGEDLCLATYKNNSNEEGYIGVTPRFPGKVVPVNLQSQGGNIKVKSGAYFAHEGSPDQMDVGVEFVCNPFKACCAGQGLSMQSLTGDGNVFLAAGGTIFEKDLAEGEVVVIDGESLVGFSGGVSMDIRKTGNCMTMCCGGEGMFNTTLTGPGKIWLQTMSYEKMKNCLMPDKPPAAAGAVGMAASFA
jgi:uncharacterized protein (AIM24 family)